MQGKIWWVKIIQWICNRNRKKKFTLKKKEMPTFQKFSQMIFGKKFSIKYRDRVWRPYRTVIVWFDAVFAVFLVSSPVLSEMRHSACCIDLVLHFRRVLQKFLFSERPQNIPKWHFFPSQPFKVELQCSQFSSAITYSLFNIDILFNGTAI